MSDNLQTLRRRASERSQNSDGRPPSNKLKLPSLAGALPWLLFAAFLLLAWLLFGDRFEPARPVDLVKVVTTRASPETTAAAPNEESGDGLSFDGGTLFQASGWIESDPLPIRVTTLYSGVVQEVHVLQGERVKKGQVLASMVDEDARLDLREAKADLAKANAELEQRRSAVAATEASLKTLSKEIEASESRRAELADQYERLAKAGNNVFRESEITQARLRVSTQERNIEALESKKNELKAKLRSDRAAVLSAEAKLENASVMVDRRQLDFDRTQVSSPVDGRIQKLYAAPGMKRMLNMEGLETSTIAKVFQPDSLQARIDVPLEEAAQLKIGQPVRLRSTLLPNRNFKGVVTRIDGQADIQRNTLQAKVRLLDPADQLRPEMLCRAEFLSSGQSGDSGSGTAVSRGGRAAVYVPENVLSGRGRERMVWALDASGERAERRSVVVDPNPRDGYLRVLEGLKPGEFVVQDPPGDLEIGERVKNKKTPM